MKKLTILAMLLIPTAQAYGEVDGNSVLHFGVSATINSVLYLSLSRAMKLEREEKLPLLIGTSAFTLVVGLGMEAADSIERNDRNIDLADMGANVLGVGLSAAAIYFLDIDNVKPTATGLQIGWEF
jgi:hypothetical protein